MPPDDLVYLALSEAADLVRRRTVSPVELTLAALERIERLNPVLNAFITVTAELALADARAAESAIQHGEYRGPLHGIPYSLKDLVETAGIRTTAGSPVLNDFVPKRDAPVYERLRTAGGVLLGKNAMLEFAYGAPHPEFGLTRNPWNLDYSASGSSSGSAVAVAAGLGYASIGSDTAGSIRIPASWCGVVGLKPTYGLVSLRGIIPLATSLDHVGPMGRTARDVAIVLSVIAGYDGQDRHSANVRAGDYLSRLAGPRPVLRIGLDRDAYGRYAAREVGQAVEQAVSILAGWGSRIVPVSLPAPAEAAPVASLLLAVEAASYHRDTFARQPMKYSDAVAARLRRGAAVTAVDYHAALQAREQIRDAYRALFDDIDVLVAPTSVIPSMTLDEVRAELTLPPADPMSRRTLFTAPINLVGFPAVALPVDVLPNGLPAGVQLVGRPYDEATLLALAHYLGEETRVTSRHPAL